MAVYGTSPFAKFSSQSFEKHVSPIASFAAQPPLAWTQSSASSAQQQSGRFHQRPHAPALVVLMLLACALSAAYIMKPDRTEGSGDMPSASYLLLLRRQAAAQQLQHKAAARCKLLHSGGELHSVDTALCVEETAAGAQQRITIWRHTHRHTEGRAAQGSSSSGGSYLNSSSSDPSSNSSDPSSNSSDPSSSRSDPSSSRSSSSKSSSDSGSYLYSGAEGSDYGRRRIKLHRKALLHIVQQ